MRLLTSHGRILSILVIGSAIALAGCGGGPKTVPVAGTATVDGKPLSGFVVTFIPDGEKGHSAEVDCSARLGANGEYALRTDDRYDVYKGAPPGWYKVTIWSPDDKPIPVNPKYTALKSTPLSIEVVPAAPPGAYDLNFTK